MKFYSFCFLLAASLLLLCHFGCKKISGLSIGSLAFSKDTLVFDTVFTTIGSTTQQFKIYNTDSKSIAIDEVQLMGGANSPFRMNLDGLSGTAFSDIVLDGKDSLFVFVEVTLNVNNQSYPLVIQDSIRFRTNGKDQYIQLVVWGQDVYYHYSYLGPGTKTYDLNEGVWPNDKPHLIYGAAFVDEDKSLTIQEGTKIYLHKNALLYVYKGTLVVNGTLNNEVTIQGDRLEASYNDIPGQYYGIYFDSARPSSIDYAIIKNGTSGIHLFDKNAANLASEYTLTIRNSKIYNHQNNGIFMYAGARVKAENCVISKNGGFALLVLVGGDFNFSHCDLLGYNSQSQNQAVGIVNHYVTNNTQYIGSIHEGTLNNCVVYGSNNSEIAFDTIPYTGVTLNFNIHNCLLRKENVDFSSIFTDNLWNLDPKFEDVGLNKFIPLDNSPLKGSADPNFPAGSWTNINGEIISPPNIGAY
jgi:hypothetical protein